MGSEYNRSFLKWAGGKYAALDHVFKTVPRTGEHWVEPFVGSATVALNTNYRSYTLADSNQVLIHLYRMIVNDPHLVIAELRKLFTPEHNQKAMFLKLRAEFNLTGSMDRKAILFIYLNRHCYNGLSRFNKKDGHFNVSFGSYKSIYLPVDEILFFAKKFKSATFIHSCFSELHVEKPKTSSSTVYCDPPYLKVSKTAGFVSYTSEGFYPKDHIKLNQSCQQWRSDGFRTYVSNSDVPPVSEYYADMRRKKHFNVRRSISSKGDQRNGAKEVLLVY